MTEIRYDFFVTKKYSRFCLVFMSLALSNRPWHKVLVLIRNNDPDFFLCKNLNTKICWNCKTVEKDLHFDNNCTTM